MFHSHLVGGFRAPKAGLAAWDLKIHIACLVASTISHTGCAALTQRPQAIAADWRANGGNGGLFVSTLSERLTLALPGWRLFLERGAPDRPCTALRPGGAPSGPLSIGQPRLRRNGGGTRRAQSGPQ